MADARDIYDAQIEKVRGKLDVLLYEASDQIASLIKRTEEVEQISNFLYRIPVKKGHGGQYRKFSANEGTLGKGTGMVIDALTAGYFYSVYAMRIPLEARDTSMTREQSIINVFAEQLAGAMQELQVWDDIVLHTDGKGILTNASSAITAGPPATMTFAGATDNLGINKLREYMTVDVWNSAGTTKRVPATAAPLIITAIDYGAKQITFDQGVTALAATDIIALRDMDIYGPASLTSFSSTWPSRGAVGGLGGDSFRHGIYYSNDNTAANYYLGLQKSAVPQLLPTRVNGNSAGLTFEQILLLRDGIRQRRTEDALNGAILITHMSQRAAAFKLGTSIANKLVSGETFGRNLDLIPANQRYDDTFEAAGMLGYVSKRQDKSRVDLINPGKWGRAQVRDTYFFGDWEGGRRIFEGRNASGEVTAYMEAFLVQGYDFVNFDPGCQGYIDALQLPTGY